jgi:hypothetical protein
MPKTCWGDKSILNQSVIRTDAILDNLAKSPNLAKLQKINLPLCPITLRGKNQKDKPFWQRLILR